MEQSINIADLVKPKFKPGQVVWVVTRNYNNRIEKIYTMRVNSVGFYVGITNDKGVEKRTVALKYYDHHGTEHFESSLIGSLNEIGDNDRAPTVA
jgi:hypothetical protein